MAGAVGRDPFAETEDQAALRQLARDVAERELAPRARDHDESGDPPLEAAKALATADLLRVTIGEEWGGFGYGDVEASLVLEELARADVSSAIWAQLTFNGPPRGIEHLGPPAMKDALAAEGGRRRGAHLASASPSPTPGRPCRRCAPRCARTAPASGSTATRTTRPSATWRRGSSCGAAGRAATARRASARS